MNITEIASFKRLKDIRYWLLGIAGGLEAICLTLVWKADDTGHLGMSLLFLFAVGSLTWEKRHTLKFESEVVPSIVGVGLIGWVLWQSANLADGNIMRLLSFVSALGVALLASGFQGLKQYWQELMILFFLGVPSVIASFLYDISPLTAKFSAFLLHYLGFEVMSQGVFINLPNGGIEVTTECSGIDTIVYILSVSVLALIMFPVHRTKRFFVPFMAIIIGFVINGVRVAMLAIFAASDKAAFESWHGGQASYLYGMIGILIFGCFYWLILQQEEKAQINNSSQS
ncbi:exosortase, cyanobacterial variant [Rivularia sp. PCC 7116]|uniref:cyanoexosortase A n=1 Tax=Rivularia sp. PCC 7116 TaxID=373994 RepID=UPI00029F3AED|nr:cyanoexosortase A [Rivularia sp. PCC 7116]AFY58419.1 exosortase, cyanobacterial variant [Rivularia sp. PCC 7116]